MLISLSTKVYSQTEWIKYENNPVLDPGPTGAWDDESIWILSVLFDGTTYHMWYANMTDGSFINIGYATSLDGSVWTKADGQNPVLDWGEPGSWDDSSVAGCSVIFDTATYKMWYQGIDESVEGHIGYATSSTIGIDENIIVQTNDYLLQNYPNPFNPTTMISFSIEQNEQVKLVIYNLKGQKVKDLSPSLCHPSSDGHRPEFYPPGRIIEGSVYKNNTPRPSTDLRMTRAGSTQHSVVWNGTDDNNNPVSSGIYFYKICLHPDSSGKTANFEKTKKMILIK